MALFRALSYIETHLDEDISLDATAAAVFYSPYHFHRLFRKLTGETLGVYVRRLRLENGAFLLRSGRSVTETALASGYWTHEAFTRAFRRTFGRAPRDFAVENPPDGTSDVYLDRPRRSQFEGLRGWKRRLVGPYENTIPPSRSGNPWPEGALRRFGVSWDDPAVTNPEHTRYDALWTGPRIPGCQEAVLEPGSVLTALHSGPFTQLTVSYSYLIFTAPRRWGLRVHQSRPPFEEFLPEGIRVFVPLER